MKSTRKANMAVIVSKKRDEGKQKEEESKSYLGKGKRNQRTKEYRKSRY